MLEQLDDHYTSPRYRYNGKQSHFQTIREGQRWNYPFLFNRQAVKGYWFKGQMGHRQEWFKEKNDGR